MKQVSAALVKAQQENHHHAEKKAIRDLFHFTGRAGRQESMRPIIDRLMERVAFGSSDCWHWIGVANNFGYGRITHNGRLQVAHRISWEFFNGTIPEGMSVLHRCDNASCINPEHLWLGTYSDNLKDAWDKGRNKGNTGKGKK